MSVAQARSQEIRDDGASNKSENVGRNQEHDSYDSDDSFIDNSEQGGRDLPEQLKRMMRDGGTSFRANSTANQPSQVQWPPIPQRHEHPHQQLDPQSHQRPTPLTKSHASTTQPAWMRAEDDENWTEANKRKVQERRQKDKQSYRRKSKPETEIQRRSEMSKYKMAGSNQPRSPKPQR